MPVLTELKPSLSIPITTPEPPPFSDSFENLKNLVRSASQNNEVEKHSPHPHLLRFRQEKLQGYDYANHRWLDLESVVSPDAQEEIAELQRFLYTNNQAYSVSFLSQPTRRKRKKVNPQDETSVIVDFYRLDEQTQQVKIEKHSLTQQQASQIFTLPQTKNPKPLIINPHLKNLPETNPPSLLPSPLLRQSPFLDYQKSTNPIYQNLTSPSSFTRTSPQNPFPPQAHFLSDHQPAPPKDQKIPFSSIPPSSNSLNSEPPPQSYSKPSKKNPFSNLNPPLEKKPASSFSTNLKKPKPKQNLKQAKETSTPPSFLPPEPKPPSLPFPPPQTLSKPPSPIPTRPQKTPEITQRQPNPNSKTAQPLKPPSKKPFVSKPPLKRPSPKDQKIPFSSIPPSSNSLNSESPPQLYPKKKPSKRIPHSSKVSKRTQPPPKSTTYPPFLETKSQHPHYHQKTPSLKTRPEKTPPIKKNAQNPSQQKAPTSPHFPFYAFSTPSFDHYPSKTEASPSFSSPRLILPSLSSSKPHLNLYETRPRNPHDNNQSNSYFQINPRDKKIKYFIGPDQELIFVLVSAYNPKRGIQMSIITQNSPQFTKTITQLAPNNYPLSLPPGSNKAISSFFISQLSKNLNFSLSHLHINSHNSQNRRN